MRRIGSNKDAKSRQKKQNKFFFQRSNQTSFFFLFFSLVFPPCLNVVAKLLTKGGEQKRREILRSFFLFFIHFQSIDPPTQIRRNRLRPLCYILRRNNFSFSCYLSSFFLLYKFELLVFFFFPFSFIVICKFPSFINESRHVRTTP